MHPLNLPLHVSYFCTVCKVTGYRLWRQLYKQNSLICELCLSKNQYVFGPRYGIYSISDFANRFAAGALIGSEEGNEEIGFIPAISEKRLQQRFFGSPNDNFGFPLDAMGNYSFQLFSEHLKLRWLMLPSNLSV